MTYRRTKEVADGSKCAKIKDRQFTTAPVRPLKAFIANERIVVF